MALIPRALPPDLECDIAYKEWAGVCHALGLGRQTMLLRKGGIEERGGAFRPEYPRFWMYPTDLHQAQQGIREVVGRIPPAAPGSVAFQFLAEVEQIWWIDRLDVALELVEFCVWTDETIRRRFEYRRPGLWALSVRVRRLDDPVVVPECLEYAGCKTWVLLDRPIPFDGATPVLTEDEALRRREAISRRIDGASDRA